MPYSSLFCAFLLCSSLHGSSVSVLDSISNRPIAGALIKVTDAQSSTIEVETDGRGQVDLSMLTPGLYRIYASCVGYADLSDPLERGHTLSVLSRSEASVQIRLTPTAAIAGLVMREDGHPARHIRVIALWRRMDRGAVQWVPTGDPVWTDDRGRYRLYGLPPGHYAVAAIAGDYGPDGRVFSPVFSPGATHPRAAQVMLVQAGEVVTQADVTLPTSTTGAIRGVVSGIPENWQGKRAAVTLAMASPVAISLATVLTDSKGAFTMPGVPAGDYQVTAWGPITTMGDGGPVAGPNALAAASRLHVEAGSTSQVDLPLQKLVTVQGRLTVDASGPDGDQCGSPVRFQLHSMDGWPDTWSSHISIDHDRFVITELPAGRYRVELDDFRDRCRVTEVRVGDVISETASILVDGAAQLTMVLGGSRGTVTGVVTTAGGHVASGWVALVPDDPRRAARSTRLDADGRYQFDKVPPGPYFVVPVSAMESLDYLDPVAAQALGALPVIVKTNRSVNANIRSAQ